jgi:RNA polymerase subunit RPABC4/transcription elongation factor Spt4
VLGEDALTESQLAWLHCQVLLDDGAEACPDCGAVDLGLYCRHCGTLKVTSETPQHTCPQCQRQGAGAYCAFCGAVLLDPLGDALEAGVFDWQQWAQSLTPFLGGFTAKERAAMAQEGSFSRG